MNDALKDWLRSIDLDQYYPLFAENEVDLKTLSILDDADLKELGLPFGPRKRLLKAAAGQAAPRPAHAAPGGARDGERRQVTAFFCDIVGFTELSQRLDPEDLRTIIRAYEDACAINIARYEGYVYQLRGDGVVAVFGYPLTHEGEAERAIRAGLEILDAVANLTLVGDISIEVRIGIASGIIVMSSGEENLVGDAMNIAARLEAVANPGSVVVSADVHDLARGIFDYEDLGDLTLKGLREPIHAFRVLKPRETATRFDAAHGARMTPLVGREAELERIKELWAGVAAGNGGQAVMIGGEPGIGKSRLVDAARQALATGGDIVITLQCSPFHRNSAFYPLKVAFERRAGPNGGTALDQLEHLVKTAGNRPVEDVRYLAAALSVPYEARHGPIQMAAGRVKSETIALIADILHGEDRPTLLLIEDLHWADPGTIEVLRAMLAKLGSGRTMIIGTHRPEFEDDWGAPANVTTLTLDPLSARACGALVRDLIGGKLLNAGLAKGIAERAGGIPLFIEELTKTIMEQGLLNSGAERFIEPRGVETDVVPGTLRELLMARLDQSGPAKRVAQIGAIIGREFDYETLADLGVMTEPELSQALERLCFLELAHRTGSGCDASYLFKHALVQDAARDSLLRRERRALHKAVAQMLERRRPDVAETEPETLAQHYTEAKEASRALGYWQKAGAAAVARFALPEAIAYLRQGLALINEIAPSADRDRIELAIRTQLGPLVVAEHGWGNDEIARVLEPAWPLAVTLGDSKAFVPILNTLGVHYFSICDMPASLKSAEQLLAAGRETARDDLEVMGHRAASAAHFWMGSFEDARAHGDAVREMYRPERHWHIADMTNTDPFSGEGVYRSQYLWMMGYPDQARIVADEKDENARRRGHPFDRAFALTLGAQVFDYLKDPEALMARADEAEEVGRKHGLALLAEVMVQIIRGIAHHRAGDWAQGARLLDDAITRLAATGHKVWLSYLRALYAEALAMQGRTAEALPIVERSLSFIEGAEELAHHAEVLRIKGWLHARAGDSQAAVTTLDAAAQAARRQGARSWELRSVMTMASVVGNDALRTKARERVSQLYDWFGEGHDTPDLRLARSIIDGRSAA